MSKTYVPEDRRGWWGGLDKRVRCAATDKVALTEIKAKLAAARIKRSGKKVHDEFMNAYHCRRCGHWHVGHGRIRYGTR